ncbi:uncharacterized protein BJ171DRAFT_458324 [Polychytrium aggregatum]|uniref:uncharacterized protein n=1 Tax=Polychytrium aggregatum TaxID=110093 RepID=UPI0022FDB7A4|nr:uncharacterized protein BJ171DRAFT_458324 [Polychytrium aggregatum]KAI9205679.1 hypothetical protein BJ171DRAFT_458324 [Polychytrium aggregatum]
MTSKSLDEIHHGLDKEAQELVAKNYQAKFIQRTVISLLNEGQAASEKGEYLDAYILLYRSVIVFTKVLPKGKDYKQDASVADLYKRIGGALTLLEQLKPEVKAMIEKNATGSGPTARTSISASSASGSQTATPAQPVSSPASHGASIALTSNVAAAIPAASTPATANPQLSPSASIRSAAYSGAPIVPAAYSSVPLVPAAYSSVPLVPSNTPPLPSHVPLVPQYASSSAASLKSAAAPGYRPALTSAQPQPRPVSTAPIQSQYPRISAQDLYRGLTQAGTGKSRVIVVDIRPTEEFVDGHIRWPRVSRSDGKPPGGIVLIEPGSVEISESARDLEEHLASLGHDAEAKSLFYRRNEFDIMIYHDGASTANSPAGILRKFMRLIHEMEFDKTLKQPPILLDGGFQAWNSFIMHELPAGDSAQWIEYGEAGSNTSTRAPELRMNGYTSLQPAIPVQSAQTVQGLQFAISPPNTFPSGLGPGHVQAQPGPIPTQPTMFDNAFYNFGSLTSLSTAHVNPSTYAYSAQYGAYPTLPMSVAGSPNAPLGLSPQSTPPPLLPKTLAGQSSYPLADSTNLLPPSNSLASINSDLLQQQLDQQAMQNRHMAQQNLMHTQHQIQNIQMLASTHSQSVSANSSASNLPSLAQPGAPQAILHPVPQVSTPPISTLLQPSATQHPPLIPPKPLQIQQRLQGQDQIVPRISLPTRASSPSPSTTLYFPPPIPKKPANFTTSSATDTAVIVPMGGEVALFSQMNQNIGLVGLKNMGNTCYMNSIIQCLSGTVPLSRFFLDGSFRRFLNCSNRLGTQGNLANRYAELIKSIWSNEQTVISPFLFKKTIGQYVSQFQGDEQHDSQEFLANLLDRLHEDLNVARIGSKPPPKSIEDDGTIPEHILAQKSWALYKEQNWSVIVDLFQGQLKSTLTCLACGKTSTTFNPFMYLSVPIPATGSKHGKVTAVGLRACLDKFVEEETLDGDDRWHCPKCKVARKATKRLEITKLPVILLIHLKRFYQEGPFRNKIETYVEFNIASLDLTSYMPSWSYTGPRGQIIPYKYDLFAVSNHMGGLNGGHYTAYVKNQQKNWYLFDDSTISNSNESVVQSNAAYILFYIRQNTPGIRPVEGPWFDSKM